MSAPAAQRVTAKKRAAFLQHLRAGHSISRAALGSGVDRRSWYRHREDDPEFAAAWDEALEEGADGLEDEARRRAVEGTQKPVYYLGQQVGSIREFSDTLLIFLLKGKRPDTYRDNATVKHQGDPDHPLKVYVGVELEDI